MKVGIGMALPMPELDIAIQCNKQSEYIALVKGNQ